MLKALIITLFISACNAPQQSPTPTPVSAADQSAAVTDSIVPPQYDATGHILKVVKSDAQWKKDLSSQEYKVLREEGTERAFTGDLLDNHKKGVFVCRACHLPLFDSATKFESGTGWPSFYQPLKPEYVTEKTDNDLGMTRTEVECARCGGHLGHVFDDGPQPTGLRYCMNSVSMDFVPR